MFILDKEKRMAGNYTIIHAIHIGDKEVVFGINDKNVHGQQYMCGYCTRNEIFERYDENLVSNDYLEIMSIFCDRVKAQIEKTKTELSKITVKDGKILPEMCFDNDFSKSILEKVVAIKTDVLRPEYQRDIFQLHYITGGFGSEANSRGSACFCTNLYTGENTRWERFEIQGEVKSEHLPDWAVKKIAEIQNKNTEREER